MIPPPMTSIVSGISWRFNAPVESMILGSSGRNGSLTGSEPAAMMAFSNRTVVVPLFDSIWRWWESRKVPFPVRHSTLRCFASDFRPLVSLPTTEFFHAESLIGAIFGVPKSIPWSFMACASSMTFAAWSKALEGMHPTFRQTPPRLS